MDKRTHCSRHGQDKPVNSICDCWRKAHPEVIEAREDCDNVAKILNGILSEVREEYITFEGKKSGIMKKLCDAIRNFAVAWQHEGGYCAIHKCGRYSDN